MNIQGQECRKERKGSSRDIISNDVSNLTLAYRSLNGHSPPAHRQGLSPLHGSIHPYLLLEGKLSKNNDDIHRWIIVDIMWMG